MASTGSVDSWPLGPTEFGEAGLRVLLCLPTQASSSYTELKSSCARHDVRIRISSIHVNTPTCILTCKAYNVNEPCMAKSVLQKKQYVSALIWHMFV